VEAASGLYEATDGEADGGNKKYNQNIRFTKAGLNKGQIKASAYDACMSSRY